MMTTTLSKKLILGGLLGGVFALSNTWALSVEEAEKILERSQYESVKSVMDLVENAPGKTGEEKAEKRRELLLSEESKRVALSTLISDGEFLVEAKANVAGLEVEQKLKQALVEDSRLQAAAQKIADSVKSSDPETWGDARAQELKGTPFKLNLSGLESHPEEDEVEFAKLSIKLNEDEIKNLSKHNKDLSEALTRYSGDLEEQKKLLKKIAEDISSEGIFQEKISNFADLSNEAAFIKPVASVQDNLKKSVKKLGDINNKLTDLGAAQDKLRKMEELEDAASSRMATELSLMKELVDQYDIEDGFKGVSACAVLAKELYVDELSDEDKKSCRSEIALFKAKRDLAGGDSDSKEPTSSDAADASAETKGGETAEGTDPQTAEDTVAKARKERLAQLEQQLAQDPNFGYRQMVGNLVVPSACGPQSINQALPFADNPTAEKKLDRLEEGLAAQMTACKSTGYVDEEMMAFSTGLMDGGTLATDAMDKLFGQATASNMTVDQTKDLKSEKKCLDRSAQAMRRGLVLTRLEVARVAKEKARSKLFKLRNENPMLFSQELARKRMELSAMGMFNAFTSEEDLSQALYDEYKTKYAEQLHTERNVDQMASNLKIVQTLGIEVNSLYNERTQYIAGSGLQPSTRTYERAVAPTTSTRTAPSRDTRAPGGNRTRTNPSRRTPTGTTPNFI
ncbi:hypothetical protein GW915_10255 [bacterium]|nr:hypothetical protein [bacterium]